MRKFTVFAYQVLLLLGFLGVLFVPFSFQYLNIQSKITKLLFEDFIIFTASHFENAHIVTPEISSDSTSFYFLFFILFLLAIIFAALFSFSGFWKKNQSLIVKVIQLILTYYLSVIMLKYGFDKIFKTQFYLPEPNTLYTPLGMLDKDILFWSTMGTSYSYNLFMGLIEVIPALMLLFHKTRILGLFILSGVLINVVLINLGFDISVKLYSLFLLLLCLLLLAPYFKKIWQFFVLNQTTVLSRHSNSDVLVSKSTKFVLKLTVLVFLFFESFYPHIQNKGLNDDNVPRSELHGAYQVLKVEKERTSGNSANLKIKRIFIHRHNYFIFQYENDTMEDFYLEVIPTQNQITLTNYDGKTIKLKYKYSETSKILELKSVDLGITIYSKSLPWRNLPLLQPLFHWTVDEINN